MPSSVLRPHEAALRVKPGNRLRTGCVLHCMGTLHITISPFGATSPLGAAIASLPSPWGSPQGNGSTASKQVRESHTVPAKAAAEPRRLASLKTASAGSGYEAGKQAGREAVVTGRDTLLPFKTEATFLPRVEDAAMRQGQAASPLTAVVDPAKAAEQEQTKRLVLLCISGDPAAWQQLVTSQYRRIYGICYRFTGSQSDAEDLTQEAFLKLYRALGSFDPAKGAFQTWITTLTRNLLVDHFRRTRQDRATDSLDIGYGDEDGPTKAEQLQDGRRDQFSHVAQMQLRARIQHALRQLSPELREAVILRDLQDMDYKEISAVLRVPEGTVKSRISRGRGELARILSREGRREGGREDLHGTTEGLTEGRVS